MNNLVQLSDTFWIDLDKVEAIREYLHPHDHDTNIEHVLLSDTPVRRLNVNGELDDKAVRTGPERHAINVFMTGGTQYVLRGEEMRSLRAMLDQWRSR